jgi:hypothetical protein
VSARTNILSAVRRPAVILALGLLVPAAAGAGVKPRTITAYCSPSGDVCYGVADIDGKAVLHITTAARYFKRYTLCVRPPGRAARCGWYPVFRLAGSTWSSSIRFARQFPYVGEGTYRATWKLGARRLGPTLSFRLPL